MGTLHFYDKNRILIFEISNIYFSLYDIIELVHFTLKISNDKFSYQDNFEAEKYDFIKFTTDLKEMYNLKKKHVIFNPLQSNLILKIEEELGVISININIFSMPKFFNIDINYLTDQSFMPDLINELERVIKIHPLGTSL